MAKEKEKLVVSAEKLAQRGQNDRAIKEFQKALELDKKDVKIHRRLGDLWSKLKKDDEAIKCYSDAAKLYTRDGFYSKAIAIYKRILEINENRDDIYLLMADLYQRLGMIGDAMTQYQRISSNYEKDGKLKEALDIYKNMAELDPRNVMILTKLAELYYKSNNKKDGYGVFKRALDELKEQNRFEEYVRLMEKLSRADPDNVDNLKELVSIYIKRKVYDRAYPFLVKVCQLVPDDLQYLGTLGELCVKLDRKYEAIVKFKELAKAYQQKGLRQKAQEALARVATLEGKSGAAPAAPAAAKAAPKADEDVVDLHEEVAEVQEHIVDGPVEELSEAVEEEAVIEEAVIAETEEEPPTFSPAQILENLTEADVYFKYGLRDKALGHIQLVLKTDPKNIEALKRLKNIMFDAGNQEAALDALRKIALYTDKAQDWGSLVGASAEILRLAPQDGPAQAWLKKANAELSKQPAPPPKGAPAAAKAEKAEVVEEEVVAVDEEPVVEEEVAFEEEAEPAPAPTPAAKAPPPPPPKAPAPPPAHAKAPKPPPVAKAPQVEEEEEVVVTGKGAAAADFKEELEEAEFYAGQGLEEESLRVYLEILQVDPSHKQALRGVKELEAIIRSKAPKAAPAPAPAAAKKETPIEIEEEEVTVAEEIVEEEVVAEEPAAPAAAEEAPAPEPAIEEEGPAPVAAAPAPEEPVAEEPMEFESEVASEHFTQPEPTPGFPEEPAFAATEEAPPEPVAEPAPSEPALEAQAKPATAAAPTPSFDAEDEGEGLFDLAAELEKEDLGPVAPIIGDMSTSEKYGFEDMFKSFKEGVRKVVSDTDASTHYDLGIAYKEMGLCEDAIREFKTALKAGHSPGDCRIMIGLCYTERGKFEQAIEEYEQGVTEPKIADKEKAALFYELGLAWMGLGDLNKSLRMFEKCQSLDGGLRDVGARVNELRARLGGAKPEIPLEPTREEVSWESAALKQPENAKTQPDEDDAKKKKGKKISYI